MLLHRLRPWEPAKVSPNTGLRNAGRRRSGLLGPVLREACDHLVRGCRSVGGPRTRPARRFRAFATRNSEAILESTRHRGAERNSPHASSNNQLAARLERQSRPRSLPRQSHLSPHRGPRQRPHRLLHPQLHPTALRQECLGPSPHGLVSLRPRSTMPPFLSFESFFNPPFFPGR